jgi:hypothetical protein
MPIQEATQVKKEVIKPMVQGIVIGAIVIVIVMFWTGWAVTSGAAAASAEDMVKEAVVENLAPICVDQYLRDPNKLERFAELKKKSSYQRDDYVNEIGWATMPGAESPVRGVADACAKRIMELAG